MPESHLHLPFHSYWDLKMGRLLFSVAFVVLGLSMYQDPGYFHETVNIKYN